MSKTLATKMSTGFCLFTAPDGAPMVEKRTGRWMDKMVAGKAVVRCQSFDDAASVFLCLPMVPGLMCLCGLTQ